MEKIFVASNSKQTQKLGEMLALELRGGEVICLSGDLGSGKTTFTQGLLKGLGARGPYTSPTFLIMKHYKRKKEEGRKKEMIEDIYHIDAYRVNSDDILDLGWEEIVADENNVIIVEWAEKITDIIPKDSLWIRFEWMREDKRKITLSNFQFSNLNFQ